LTVSCGQDTFRGWPAAAMAILELGLAGERELDGLDRAVREHLDDPRTLVMPHLTFLAWGRKPGN
jgi:hypothetical protein